MATVTPVAYYTGSTISGTEKVGNLSIGTTAQDYGVVGSNNGIIYYSTPDQDSGYIIAHEDLTGRPATSGQTTSNVGFWRTGAKTDESFLNFVNGLFLQSLPSASAAKTYLNNNGYWTDWVQVGVAIGDTAFGGTVAYILQPGDSGYDSNVQHGYILSTGSTLSYGIYDGFGPWSEGDSATDGYSNAGFSDWRLPTPNEFLKIWPNNGSLPNQLFGYFYWTNDFDSIQGGARTLFNGSITGYFNPVNNFYYRALRTF